VLWSVAEDTEASIVIRRSRFIAWVVPLLNESELEGRLGQSRQRWPGATHYVFAYRLDDRHNGRGYDAGEPHGTAGAPVLKAISQRGLYFTLVIVVRYFGGIRLGTAGLAEAYHLAAAEALDKAQKVPVPYSAWQALQDWMAARPGWCEADYAESVKATLHVEPSDVESLAAWIGQRGGNVIETVALGWQRP
jgi:putative IMPACT (imprinted ancient) family translation regulator